MFHGCSIVCATKVKNTDVAINTFKCRFNTLSAVLFNLKFVPEIQSSSSMRIEVFKTNVGDAEKAKEVALMLKQHFPNSRINIDLNDCDKILRIEGVDFTVDSVRFLVQNTGFVCEVLD